MSKPRLTAATTALAVAVSTLTFGAVATVTTTTTASAANIDGAWTQVGSTRLNEKVYVLAQEGAGTGTVYAGGFFTNAGGNANADYIASIDASNSSADWQALSTSPLTGGYTYTGVYAIAPVPSSNNVFIGGNFNDSSSTTLRGIALWDGSTTSAFTALTGGGLAAFTTGDNGVEEIVAIDATTAYVSGYFTNAGGVASADNLALYRGGWIGPTSTPTSNRSVNALAYVDATTTAMGGYFASGNTPNFGHVATWRCATVANGCATANSFLSIAGDATTTYGFSDNTARTAAALANLTGSASATYDGIYAGGNFTTTDATTPVTVNGLARWNSTSSAWEAVPSGGTGLSGTNAVVEVISFSTDKTKMYIGGNFTGINGVSATNIAEYDFASSTWSSLGCGANNGVSGAVRGILPQTDGSIIVGGHFTNAGGNSELDYVARYTPGANNCPAESTGGGGGGPAAGTPSAPQNVSASYNEALQQLTVTWSPPATDNGSGIVQYRASTADGRAECYAAPSANSCTISASDVPIPFRKPYNDRNASQSESDWVLYNTTDQVAAYLRLSAESGDQAAVSWANGVYAQARNAVGWGALGFAVAQPKRAPGVPTDVVATGKYKAVTVSYKAPADLGNPSGIAAYLVRTDTGQACITRVTSENPLECTYTDLTPGTKYTFKVQALGAVGWGEFSSASNSASPYDLKLDVLSRPEVKFLFFKRGSKLEAEGRAPGLKAGTELIPVLQLGADGAVLRLTKDTAKVDKDGNFTWSRKLDKNDNGKPASLYFTYGNDKTATLTAKLGATIGLPSAPRDVKVKSDTSGFTVSWQPPARDGGSPISEYVMTSDVRAPSWAQSKFVSCTVKAPATSCTMPGSTTVFDPNKTYTFSVVAKTERGTSRPATEKWKGQIYRLNIFKRARIDSEILLSFSAVGWANDTQSFEVQAKVGENGAWKKQGTASLDPEYVEPMGDWIGMLPKSVTAGSTVFYRLKSNKGFSNEVKFRLESSFEYSFG